MPVTIGSTVTFPEGNEIRYFQDFQFLKGVPSNVEFTVVRPSNHDDYWLEADGYGNMEKPNSYGNGRICVYAKDIDLAQSISKQ